MKNIAFLCYVKEIWLRLNAKDGLKIGKSKNDNK